MGIVTYNIQLNFSEEGATKWHNLLVSVCDAYNLCTRILTDNNVVLRTMPVHKACYNTLRSTFRDLPAQMCIRIEKEAASALRSKKSNKHTGKTAPNKYSLSTTLDKRLYGSITSDGVTLSGIIPNKRVLVPFVLYDKVRDMLSAYVPSDPTIFERDGLFYLSVPFNVPDATCDDDTAIGVDLGIKRLFVTSEGWYYSDKEYLRRRRCIRYLKRSLRSKGTKSAKRHLKKVRHKEMHMCKAMCHAAANALLSSTKSGHIVMEDLTNIKRKTSKRSNGVKRTRHNNMLSQVPFHMFRTVLTYKALLSGRKVETVSPVYTSQTDSRTGTRDGVRKGCRYYCSDGAVLDADLNAAINICKRSKHPVSTVVPTDGTLRALTGTAESTSVTLVPLTNVVPTSPCL